MGCKFWASASVGKHCVFQHLGVLTSLQLYLFCLSTEYFSFFYDVDRVFVVWEAKLEEFASIGKHRVLQHFRVLLP